MSVDSIIYQEFTGTLYSTAKVGQTLESNLQDDSDIEMQEYYIAKRNTKQYNEIPVDRDSVYINFNASKQLVLDSKLKKIVDIDFQYFVDESELQLDDLATAIPVLDGQIFRCAGEGVKNPRSYIYYIMENGTKRKIPSYKTLEVMLAERQLSYSTVRVIEKIECDAIPFGLLIENRDSEWTKTLGDSTGYSTLANLASNISTLQSITNSLKNSVQQEQTNINNQVAAQAAEMQAQAAAAQSNAAQAAANAAAAQTAQAAAQSAQAQAEATAAAAAAAAIQAEAEAAALAALQEEILNSTE